MEPKPKSPSKLQLLHPAEAFESLRDVVNAATESYDHYDVLTHVSLDRRDEVMLRIVCGEHGYQVPHQGLCPKCGGEGVPGHMVPVNPPWSTEPEPEPEPEPALKSDPEEEEPHHEPA